MISTSSVASNSNASGSHNYSVGHASMPAAAKKVVQDLKKITKHHSEEEIYSTLKECNMDPDDAVHRLMSQDTFHEVRRKRDRRKENINHSDVGEIRPRADVGKVLEPDGSGSTYVLQRTSGDVSGNIADQCSHPEENGNFDVASAASLSQPRGQMSNATASSGSLGVANERSSYIWGSLLPQGNLAKVLTRDTRVRSMQLSTSLTEGSMAKGVKTSNVTKRGDSTTFEGDSRAFSRGMEHVNEEPTKVVKGRLGGRGGTYNSYYPGRNVYQQQHSLAQNVKASSQLEWKPKMVTVQPLSKQPSLGIDADSQFPLKMAVTSVIQEQSTSTSAKTEAGSSRLQDDRPVIIPEHFQVPEAEFAALRFGSFDLEVSVSIVESLISSPSEGIAGITSINEAVHEESDDTGETEPEPVLGETEQFTAVSPSTLVTSTNTILDKQSTIVAQVEILKPEPVTTQPVWEPGFVSSLQGMGLLPPQFSHEAAEALPQTISRLPNFMPFSDPGTSYFSPVVRPASDSDSHYQYVSPNVPTKLSGGNITLINGGQNISSSQELSQTVGVSHALSIPQHPYAYAAQPAGLTISPYAPNVFGYQLVPPRYAYMHTPYQQSYSGNIGYPQPHGGGSYVTGSRGYPPSGATAFKYAPLPYKMGMAAANAPHAVIPSGYGSFGAAAAAAPGYATISPTVTSGSASSYDDMMGPLYKEHSYYAPTQQQGDGSTVWIPTPLSRDVSSMQTNSFYNVHNQGQPAGYTHSQPSHPHPAAGFASFYHLPQTASVPNTHQLLQQPQTIGSVGTAGSQAVIYQQTQHGGQLNWPSIYANLIRNP